jgi:hypothetical protein
MRGFRIDKRVFDVGDVIAPTGEFAEALENEKEEVEEILENTRPDGKPDRSSALFIFEKEEPARKRWSITTNGKIYRVEIVGNILHRGDMMLTEKIYHSLPDGNKGRHFARSYWRGDMTDECESELLVEAAEVIEVISKEEGERRDALRNRMKSYPIE